METHDACEELGIKGSIVIWTLGGDGRVEGSLTFMSSRANAVVSCGISDEPIDLPSMSRVIGTDTSVVLTVDRGVAPANEEVRVIHQLIAGAVDQFGGNRLSIEEY
jgi:hypothetical protein